MLIETVCAAAFYCQRCGKIHVHDIPYFSGRKRLVLRCDSCAHEQAVLVRCSGRRVELTIDCVVCGTANTSVYSLKHLRHVQLERVFCCKDHFELGYIGRRRRIEELLAFNQAEFAALHPNDGQNFIEKQQILLEAVNRVHEIAERGDIVCPCGSQDIAADIRGNSIVLECCHCGAYSVLRAENASDLARIGRGFDIGLAAPKCLRKK